MDSSGKLLEVDFGLLQKEGEFNDEIVIESLDEALSAYRDMHEALTIASEMPYYEDWKPFDFRLHITTHPPYKITTQIFLI